MKNASWLIVIALLVSGCATQQEAALKRAEEKLRTPAPSTGNTDGRRPASTAYDGPAIPYAARLNRLDPEDIRALVNQQLLICDAYFGNTKDDARFLRLNSLTVMMVGLVAGSVVAPALLTTSAANSTWAAAASGVAGASSVAVKSLDSAGLDGRADVLLLNDLSKAIQDDVVIALDESKAPSERFAAAARASGRCRFPQLSVPKLANPT